MNKRNVSADGPKRMTQEEWEQEAIRRFGPDKLNWKFVCPSCGYVASVQDYKDAGAAEKMVAFSCIGRVLGSPKEIGDKPGGPCNYAGGGLFRLNPVTVMFGNGHEEHFFDFAPVE